MAKKKSSKVYSKNSVQAAFFVFLSAFSLLGLLGPGTRMWVFDFVPSFLFGLLGYWLLWPGLMLLSIYALFFRKLRKKIPLARLLLGALVLFFGLAALLSHIGTSYEENIQDLNPYLGPFFESFNNDFGATLPFQLALGGGLFGYLLAGVFALPGLAPLVYVFSILFLLGGLILLIWPLIMKFVRFLSLKSTLRRGEKLRKKAEEEEKEPEEVPALSYESQSTGNGAPILGMEETYEQTPSRRARFEQDPVEKAPENPSIIPQEVEPSVYPDPNYIPQSMYGLQEAVFSLSGAPTQEGRSQPSSFSLSEAKIGPEEDPFFQTPSQADETAPIQETVPEEIIPPIEATEEEAPIFPEEAEVPPKEEENLFIEAPAPKKEPEPEPEPIPEPEPEPEPIPQPKPAPKPKEDEWVHFGDVSQPKAKKRPPYEPPSNDKLKVYSEDKNALQNQRDGEERSLKIDQAFKDLHVGAHVESYTIWPSVTRFNIQTDPSVSVTAVKKVVDDVMVRLGGVLGLFQEVVPGSATSGLEIPNRVQSIVPFKETIEAMPQGEKANLFIPFGKSIDAKVISADLSDFPHMLVSGSTGSGKSIFMHGMILSLIMRNRPEDLKLVLVDPKRVEMGKYRDIPHLLCPIIKEPAHAKVCMEKLCDEMERRYGLFENSGVSNIRQFNKDIAPEKGCEKLPFIIVVIDEYADLVDTCKDIGDPIVRLAQKARAAGIHLVIATQRPDTNVINGRIKANIAVRVALSLSSAIDSMTVLGEGGAEKLSGHGDMLVKCDQVSRIGFSRLQGCFVDNAEIRDAVEWIKEQQQVVYDPNFLDLDDHSNDIQEPQIAAPSAAQLRAASNQDKYLLIREAIMTREYTSISQIQREFSVGFPRAGKIFAQLQDEGIVAKATDSPSSSKGCRVLIHSVNDLENPGSLSQSQMVDLPPDEE
ncbi:MAG: hypothetical protein J6038_03400 [Bacilli bacterium]|nr:hypothetical protein [Bacilli bacterium]